MNRRFTLFLLSALTLLALVMAACGGDDDNGNGNSNGDDPGETPGATTENGDTAEPTETPTPRPIRTPTPVPSGDPVVLVVFEENEFFPSEEQFQALPQSTITVDGTEYSGVSLATIAAQVQAPAETTVSLDGLSANGERYAIARFALSEVGETTLLTLGEGGQLNMVSTSVEQVQWIKAVSAVSFP